MAVFGVSGGDFRPPNACVSYVSRRCYNKNRQETTWKEGGKGLLLLVVHGDTVRYDREGTGQVCGTAARMAS